MSEPRQRTFVDGGRVRAAFALVCAVLGPHLSGCIDESHDLEVQALGGETTGVSQGPLHRAGQPCLVCHGGLGPASRQFVMGGTVYAIRGQPAAAVGAQVTIEDVNGSFFVAPTNEAGNFFITTDQWSPTLPAQARVTQGQNGQQMVTHIARDGSCAACHSQPQRPSSPGAVYLAAAPMSDGGP